MTTTLRSSGLLLALALTTAVQAADFTQIYKDNVFGVSPNNATTYWFYVADATETLTMIAQQTNTSTGIPRPFSDENLENAISISPGYVNGIYQYQLNVEEGTTYYFKLVATWADSAFYMLQSEAGGAMTALEVSSISPAEGSTLDLTGTGSVVAYFNQAVTCNATATMQSGHMTNDSLAVNVISSTSSLQVEYKDTLMGWLTDGHVLAGDAVTFTFTGIASAANPDSLLNGDGTLTLSFLVPDAPVQLVEETVPQTFRSYWLPEDEDGIIRLTFDGELSAASAYLTYGDRDSETDYYYEPLTVQIDSNQIIIDLTGYLRNPSAMLASGTLYESVYIKVTNVLDSQGNSPYSAAQGSVGSYSYTLPYKDISTNFATEWLPADGKNISEKSNCELYISQSGVVLCEAFIFTFQRVDTAAATIVSDTLLIALSDVKAEDEDGGIVYTFAFPDEVKAGYNVTLSLDGLQFSDGIYTDARTAMLTVTYNPATDDELQALLDAATAIQRIATDSPTNAQATYTLSGQKVSADRNALLPGIYIMDGQKVFMK